MKTDRPDYDIDYLKVRSVELRELSRYYRCVSRTVQERARHALAASERLTNPHLHDDNPAKQHPQISRRAAAFSEEVLIPVAA
jgi:hypothetical protein